MGNKGNKTTGGSYYKKKKKTIKAGRPRGTQEPASTLRETDEPVPSTSRPVAEAPTSDSTADPKPRTFNCGPGRMYLADVPYIVSQLARVKDHGLTNCSMCDMEITHEQRTGLITKWTLTCNMCSLSQTIESQNPDYNLKNNVNKNIVLAAIKAGIGYEQAMDFLSVLGVHGMSQHFYLKEAKDIGEGIIKAAQNCMEEAAKTELKIAKDKNHIDQNGVGKIVVSTDGAWSQRSYQSSRYKALSGLATIMGCETGKVIHCGVKNRYCSLCSRSKSATPPPNHDCFKNWDGAPNGMEAAIIVEGFQESQAKYKLKYNRFIGDGDSNVHSALEKAKPYGPGGVQKIECVVHLQRVFWRKLRLTLKKKVGKGEENKKAKKLVGNINNQKELRRTMNCCFNYWRDVDKNEADKISGLQGDTDALLPHMFGYHRKCKEYFCELVGEVKDTWQLRKSLIYNDLFLAMGRIRANALSIILNKNTNRNESFNSVVNKFVGGKRVNWSSRDSYHVRAMAAVLEFNTGKLITETKKTLTGTSPGSAVKRRERDLERKRRLAKNDGPPKKKRRLELFPPNKEYGKADLPTLPLLTETEFLGSLRKNEQEVKDLAEVTVLQSQCHQWFEERQKRITSSNFRKIIARRTADPDGIAKKILAPPNIGHCPQIVWGQSSESKAFEAFAEAFPNVSVRRTGLWVWREHPYLAASPDGLVDEDAVLEIKCPYKFRNMEIHEALPQLSFLKGIDINPRHSYYDQIQGQLYATGREVGYLFVWTPNWSFYTIVRKDEAWLDNVQLLSEFYKEYILKKLALPDVSSQ